MDARYRIVCPLESGPEVRVYEIHDRWTCSNRVLTLLDFRQHPADESLIELEKAYLRREALAHDHLIRVVDVAYRGKRAGVVTEKLAGRLVLPGSLPLRQRIALQIAELVRYLHDREFFFGVLKPSQLLCDQTGTLIVNLLFSLDSSAGWKETSALRYSAPEFLESRTPARTSDLYSLGMLLYYLLTGTQPFTDKNPRHLRGKQYFATLIRPRKLNPDIPRELEDLIIDLTEKTAGGRPQDSSYVVSMLKGHATRPRISVSSIRSSVVGRDFEINTIRAFLSGFKRQPKRKFLVLRGSSGIGKSRLIAHGGILARIAGFAVCSLKHHLGGEPLMAFGNLVNRLCPDSQRLDRLRTTGELLADLKGIFLELSRTVGAVVICADDLQWMDEAEGDVYYRLCSDPDIPVLFLGALRGDSDLGPWLELERQLSVQGFLLDLTIKPLGADASKEVVSQLLGGEISDSVADKISNFSSGNPYFIHEWVRSSVTQDQLDYQERQWFWRSSSGVEKETPPSGIQQRVQSRLSHLDGLQLSVLQYASVFERPVLIDWISRMLRESSARVSDAVLALSKQDLLDLEGSLESCHITITHDWIANVVRKALSDNQRKEIHAEIARCLEEETQGGSAPLLSDSLVRHCWNSGNLRGVLDHLWEAVEALQAMRMHRRVAYLLSRAYGEELLTLDDWKSVEITVRSLYLSGRLDDCVQFAQAYLTRLPGPCDHRVAWISYVLALVHAIQGLPDAATQCCETALKRLHGRGDVELTVHLKSLLLCSLSQGGKFSQARKLYEEITFDIGSCLDPSDKLYHAFAVHLVHCEGLYSRALRTQVESIRLSVENANFVQFLGRLTYLTSIYSKLGKLDRCDRISAFCLSHGPESLNLQVERFARLNWCDGKRKQGYHRAALLLAQEATVLVPEDNNSYTSWVGFIERAKNFNYLLLPQSALDELDKGGRIAGSEIQAVIDMKLTHFWSLLLLGRLRLDRVIGATDESWNPANLGRCRLLVAYASLAGSDLERAWASVCAAEDVFPEELPYYRVRINLLKAEILLAEGKSGEAVEYAAEALAIAKDRFLFPLMAKGYAVFGKAVAEAGDPRKGRAYCLRALQVAKRVERPGLKAEIFRTLGQVESLLGDVPAARQAFAEAIRILKERSLYLSRENRESFTKHCIDPIVAERAQSVGSDSLVGPRFLQELGHLMSAIKTAPDLKSLAEAVLDATLASLPGTSANFLLKQSDGRVEILASRGQCKGPGRRLASSSGGTDLADRFEMDLSEGLHRALRVPLPLDDPTVSAELYLESNNSELSEEQLDFLTCLGPAVDLSPCNGHVDFVRLETEPDGLQLKDGRKLVGSCPKMKALFREVQLIAPSRATVLLSGESGTGKELLAAAVHELSDRAGGPFVAVNCSALPADLIENELFGHVRGAYTGADSSHPGLFEAASEGTLFLDEISAMPLSLQARLLRVLEEKKVRRVGDIREKPVNLRVIAATNLPLPDLVAEKLFRPDLFHRLNVCRLRIPPLRERLSDLGLLIQFFLRDLAQQDGAPKRLDSEALARLSLYHFPGNVRELRNIIESAYYLCSGPVISTHHFQDRLESLSMETGESGASLPRRIVRQLAAGRTCFWNHVKKPFLSRDLSRKEVREVIALGLASVNGSYRRLVEYFGLPASDYRRFMAFLTHHGCKVDFRPFRKAQ